MMLPSDVALVQDQTFSSLVQTYANNQNAFFTAFKTSFQNLLELGVKQGLSTKSVSTLFNANAGTVGGQPVAQIPAQPVNQIPGQPSGLPVPVNFPNATQGTTGAYAGNSTKPFSSSSCTYTYNVLHISLIFILNLCSMFI
jgi:hypothetical protein